MLLAISQLVHFIPQLAALARRLHDTDRTAWGLLLMLTGVGLIVLIVFACLRSTPGPNRFGAAPSASTATSAKMPGYAAPTSTTTPQAAAPRDLVNELERLAQLKSSGSLSDAEFEVLKAQALSQAGRA